MELHCLGTAGYHPNESRHTSCYFLPRCGLLLDAGTGLFRLPSLIQTDQLDIVLSHAHLDHVVGLTFLLDVLHQRPVKTVRIWGQAEKLTAIQTHLFAEALFPVALPVTWHPIDSQTEWDLAGGRMSWRTQSHPGGSVAYRFEWPATQTDHAAKMIYATDTLGAEDEAMLRWMSDPDLLLHECNFSDEHRSWAETTGHCWLGKVIQIARQTRPKQLVLTHINPIAELELGDAAADLDCQVDLATDGMRIVF